MRRLARLVATVLLIGLSVSFLFVATAAAQPNRRASQGGDPGGCAACGSCGGCGIVAILLFAIVPLVIGGVSVAGVWKSFEKAGEPGWTAIVPVYNMMIMAKIAGRDETYGLLCLIPVAGPVFSIIIIIDFCKRFDVGNGFAIGVILLPVVFWPMLGFGQARFVGGRRKRREAEEEDEDEDRPRPRRRREAEDDEDAPRPRRRRDADDEDEERPRRKRRDDD